MIKSTYAYLCSQQKFQEQLTLRFVPEKFQNLRDIQDLVECWEATHFSPLDFKKAVKAFEDLEMAKKEGIQWSFPTEPNYPQGFEDILDRPLFFMYRGQEVWNQPCLSVVGSRDPSSEAYRWMDEQLSPLVKAGVVLVSGAARGIDLHAHRICLRLQKPTLAFLPSGLNQIYPSEFNSYTEEILQSGGCLFSEFPPQQPMHRHHFQRRNRLISAMSPLLLVVQARLRSGSLMTVRIATQQGRSIATVPWSSLDFRASGTNRLIQDGAPVVLSSDDVMDLLSSEYRLKNLMKDFTKPSLECEPQK